MILSLPKSPFRDIRGQCGKKLHSAIEMFLCAPTHSVTSSRHLLNSRRPLVAYTEFRSPLKQTKKEAEMASDCDPNSSQKSF